MSRHRFTAAGKLRRDKGLPIGLALAGGTQTNHVTGETRENGRREIVNAPTRADLQRRADMLEAARDVETNELRMRSLDVEYRDVRRQLDALPDTGNGYTSPDIGNDLQFATSTSTPDRECEWCGAIASLDARLTHRAFCADARRRNVPYRTPVPTPPDAFEAALKDSIAVNMIRELAAQVETIRRVLELHIQTHIEELRRDSGPEAA